MKLSLLIASRWKQVLEHNMFPFKKCYQILSSSFGPCGGYKIITLGKNEFIITKNGNEIIKNLSYQNPSFKLISGTVNSFSENFGDGIKKMLILSRNLLVGGLELIEMGIRPSRIIKVYNRCLKSVLEDIEAISFAGGHEELRMLGITTLNGLEFDIARSLSDNIIENQLFKVEDIQIEYFQHKNFNLKVIPGAVLYNGERRSRSIQTPYGKKCRLLIFNVPLHSKSRLTGRRLKIVKKSPSEKYSLIEEMLNSFIEEEKIVAVFNGKNIDERIRNFLEDRDILNLKTIPKRFLHYLYRISSGEIICNITELHHGVVGEVTNISYEKFNENNIIIVENTHQQDQFCILISYFTRRCEEYFKNEINKVLKVVKIAERDRNFVGGGGAIELILAHKCKEANKGLNDNIIADKFSSSLEQIPRMLLKNSGRDTDHTMALLKKKMKKNSFLGINREGGISDVREAGIIESAFLESRVLETAVQLATGMLRIDNILIAKK